MPNKNKEEASVKTIQELLLENKKLVALVATLERRSKEILTDKRLLLVQNKANKKRTDQLLLANNKLVFDSSLKKNQESQLLVADKALLKQQREKGVIVLAKIELQK